MRSAVRWLLFVMAAVLLGLQLVITAFGLKELWLVAVPRPLLWLEILPGVLTEPGFWNVVLSSAECFLVAVVLAVLFLRPKAAWKLYLAPVLLMLASMALLAVYLVPELPEALRPVMVSGFAFAFLRSLVTLAALVLLARLGPAEHHRGGVSDHA